MASKPSIPLLGRSPTDECARKTDETDTLPTRLCAAHGDRVDDPLKVRFLAEIMEHYYISGDADPRLECECPMLKCRARHPDAASMIKHLKQCPLFSAHEMWCQGCDSFQYFCPEKEKCHGARRTLSAGHKVGTGLRNGLKKMGYFTRRRSRPKARDEPQDVSPRSLYAPLQSYLDGMPGGRAEMENTYPQSDLKDFLPSLDEWSHVPELHDKPMLELHDRPLRAELPDTFVTDSWGAAARAWPLKVDTTVADVYRESVVSWPQSAETLQGSPSVLFAEDGLKGLLQQHSPVCHSDHQRQQKPYLRVDPSLFQHCYDVDMDSAMPYSTITANGEFPAWPLQTSHLDNWTEALYQPYSHSPSGISPSVWFVPDQTKAWIDTTCLPIVPNQSVLSQLAISIPGYDQEVPDIHAERLEAQQVPLHRLRPDILEPSRPLTIHGTQAWQRDTTTLTEGTEPHDSPMGLSHQDRRPSDLDATTLVGSSTESSPTDDDIGSHCKKLLAEMGVTESSPSPSTWACPFPDCGYVPRDGFGTKVNLAKHCNRSHTGKTKVLFPCERPGCDTVLGRSDNLAKHEREMHGYDRRTDGVRTSACTGGVLTQHGGLVRSPAKRRRRADWSHDGNSPDAKGSG